ncbi:DUF6461 domain-containing protein [Nonomuraea sp. KM90]|uniref:DUF6461 domain-containing protein n=1 Tax=Nonomuraea sp. KM90 TaxID=3457428 RepID=UPI003FCE72D4
MPDELVETRERIDSVCPTLAGLHFRLAKHLTGIPLTQQLLEQSTYLSGVVPGPR